MYDDTDTDGAAPRAEDDLTAAELAYAESRALVAAEAEGDERAVEAALRPRTLDEVVGQTRVRAQLGLVLEAARRRGRPSDHVLLSGPPGLLDVQLTGDGAAEIASRSRGTPRIANRLLRSG